MRIAVVGNDRRFACLARLLRHAGHELTNEPAGAELAVTRWPPDADISGAARCASIGPANPEGDVLDLLRDEEYQHEIAYMTAEGAVSAAMQAGSGVLRGAECLVVGWGRIGKALTGLLVRMGARVAALSRRADAFEEISGCGATPGYTCDVAAHLPGKTYIFSTPPSPVLDSDALVHADEHACIIDLASPPYGVDIAAAQEMGLKAWREPGLPGRYCPETAAAAIYRALIRAGLLKGE